MPRLRFPKAARLTRASEFERVRHEGRSVHGRLMLMGILRTQAGPARAGFVTSRRVGPAVVRNRIRRRLREVLRAARPILPAGLWLVIVAKAGAAHATFAALRDEWTALGKKAGIFLK